ncbi:MAG: 30S ribosomal protein S3 [bacterium]|nr:30S ribosomal protein S3 [bacterium]
MSHKVNPKGFRVGILFGWNSRWFARRHAEFAQSLREDLGIKKFLQKELKNAGVAKYEIERTHNAITIFVHSATPGMIIGRQGSGVEQLKQKIKQQFFGSKKILINLNIIEVTKPGQNAALVLFEMIMAIEKRMPYRRVLKQALDRAQKAGAQGVKVHVSGRLNGAEIARSETLSWGKIPLHTLRADIDYSRGVAHTIFGTIGVKVWIYKGEVFEE